MHVVVVTIDVKLEAKDGFVAATLENARSSVAGEPGCSQFDVVQDERNPTRIYLYEVYRDKAAFEIHMTMAHYFAWRDTVKDLFAAPPVLGAGRNLFPADAVCEQRKPTR
jgi:quinol monooxygenase YgiN